MAKKQNLAERLERVRKEMDWRPIDLARAAKVTKQNMSNWMSGRVEQMLDPQAAINLAVATGRFSAIWILAGHGDPYDLPISAADRKLIELVNGASQERKAALRLILPGLDTSP